MSLKLWHELGGTVEIGTVQDCLDAVADPVMDVMVKSLSKNIQNTRDAAIQQVIKESQEVAAPPNLLAIVDGKLKVLGDDK